MTVTTTLVVAILGTLSACGSDGSSTPDDSASSAPTSATPSTEPTSSISDEAAAIVGDWEAPEAQWVVHFHDDGTFVEDYEGNVDFRVGTFTVEGTTVSLIGDDGNTDPGTIEGESIVFQLGTLVRK